MAINPMQKDPPHTLMLLKCNINQTLPFVSSALGEGLEEIRPKTIMFEHD
jgi:hypothetical protein